MTTLKEIENVLCKNLFKVNIKDRDVYTSEEMYFFGTPTTGNYELDRSIREETRRVMLSIKDMLNYNKQGITLSIVDKRDTDNIYKILSFYSETYHNHIKYNPNSIRLSEEDISNIDNFVNKIFYHAKHYSNSSVTKTLGMYGTKSFFKPKETVQEPEPTHLSLKGTIRNDAFRNNPNQNSDNNNTNENWGKLWR